MNTPRPVLLDKKSLLSTPLEDDRSAGLRLRLRIPKQYHHEPVISNLVQQYELTVNISAALLGANVKEDGWFDLELFGKAANLRNSLLYMNDLGLEIWYDEDEDGGW